MKQAVILIDEIKRKQEATKKTDSVYLKRDYVKSIRDDIRELKTYCKFKNLSFSEIRKKYKF